MSVIPAPSPTCDAVLAAVAGGSVTVPGLVAATGRTRVAANHAVARPRARALRVAGPVGGQEAAQLLARAGVGIPGDPGGHGLGVEGRRNGAGSVEAVLGGLSHARDGTVRNRP